jgi:trehalose 6-phosphate phosphatase
VARAVTLRYGLRTMQSAAPVPSPSPAPSREWCLFLDVDGTLLELAETPEAVVVDLELKDLLVRLAQSLGGAVALVSGRSIDVIDRMFAPLRLPCAGLHGLERRTAAGERRGAQWIDERLGAARASLAAFVDTHPGILLEDKGRALAVHFRMAPRFAEAARRAVGALAAWLPGYHVQEGKMVLEIKPQQITKGTAVEAFMDEPPFRGRKPVFVGDDLTDQDGLRAAERLGGISVAVGNRIEGQWRLESPGEVRRWLAGIAALA